MLKTYSFKNYKSFGKGKIEIKPITILLGANNVGKTSLLQILMLMQQTNNIGNKKYKSAFKLHDRYVSMGSAENLFKDRNTRSPLEVAFEFKSESLYRKLKQELLAKFSINLQSTFIHIYHAYNMDNNKLLLKEVRGAVETLQSLNSRSLRKETKGYEKKIKSISSALEKLSDFKNNQIEERELFLSKKGITHTKQLMQQEAKPFSKTDYVNVFEFINKVKDIDSNTFELAYKITHVKNEELLKVKSIYLKNNDKLIIGIDFDSKGNHIELFSDFLSKTNLNTNIASLKKVVNPERTVFRVFDEQVLIPENNYLAKVISTIFIEASSELSNNFNSSNLVHISPLRAFPKRFYFLDKAETDLTDGSNLVEVLKENQEVTDKVNDWLKRFDIEVSTSQFKEVVHRLQIAQHGRPDLDLDITDVGFGVSQILPIIVQGFISEKNSLTVIEQPEIHLHPKMQAELADLFIDISGISSKDTKEQRDLFIETHSEYLLKRLRRRIAEKKISSEDIAIYFVHARNGVEKDRLERIDISEKGEFEFPSEFYDYELEDIMSFYMNQ